MQLLIWVMCGALVLFLFVAAFIVDNCDYKINRLAKKRERSRQTDIDILEYKLIQLHIRCGTLEDNMKKLREEVKGNE